MRRKQCILIKSRCLNCRQSLLAFDRIGAAYEMKKRCDDALLWSPSVKLITEESSASRPLPNTCVHLWNSREARVSNFTKKECRTGRSSSHTQHLHRAGDIIWPWVIPSLIYLLGSNIKVPGAHNKTRIQGENSTTDAFAKNISDRANYVVALLILSEKVRQEEFICKRLD